MAVLSPKCLSDLKRIDGELAKAGALFWKNVWNNDKNLIPKHYKYLMAFCIAVGSNRLDQAARELVKAYGEGASFEEITEVMEMIAWNTGIPYFTCEFNDSAAMKVYEKIRQDCEAGIPREQTIPFLKQNIIHKKAAGCGR